MAHALHCGCGCCVYCVRCKPTVSAVHMWVCVKATCEGQHSRITLSWHTCEVTAVESASPVVDRCYLVCDWLPQLLHVTNACGSQISLFWHTYIRSNSCWTCSTCSWQMLSCLWLVTLAVALNKCMWQSNSLSMPCVYARMYANRVTRDVDCYVFFVHDFTWWLWANVWTHTPHLSISRMLF